MCQQHALFHIFGNNRYLILKLGQLKEYYIRVIPCEITWILKTSHLTLMDFVEFLSGKCIHQEIKILKYLSIYHVWSRNYDHLKYGHFSLNTKPLVFLAFWNCFYSAIFNRKHLKFGLAIHFCTMISKTMYLAKHFIKQVCGGVLKLTKLPLKCFSFHFQRAISWQGKYQIC